MANFAVQLLMIVMALVAFAGVPIAIIWGWVRWARDSGGSTFWSKVSFVGFLLANASVCTCVVGVASARDVGGFPDYGPQVSKMMWIGACISPIGFVISLIGCWRPSVLRWIAPLSAAGAMALWVITAGSE